MAKLYAAVGFAEEIEGARGVIFERQVVKKYYGELIRNTRRLESSGQVNDNITVNNEISIVADPYARENFHAIRYIEFMGAKWKVTGVEVQYPRLILSVGGVYNVNDET